VHHSRTSTETNTNYGNLFSVWDRLFGTFTPSHEGTTIVYGLAGLDRPELQTMRALLALPFRPGASAGRREGAPTRLAPKEVPGHSGRLC
jgi:hypothetical protein